jgi:hypothetical protein
MALPDLTGQNIENTYQRVLQTEGTVIYDGTGSIFLPVSASYAVTASYAEYAVSASHEITKEVSSSYADYAQESGLSTSSISASYAITASYALNSPDTFPYTGSAIISGSLEVDGTTKLDGDTTITGSNSLAGNYALKVTNTSGADILNVENDGNVGIGTDNPSSQLHLQDGTSRFKINTTAHQIEMGTSGNFFNTLTFSTGTMTLNNSGNTGNDTFKAGPGYVYTNLLRSGINGDQYSKLTLQSRYYGISTATSAMDFMVFGSGGSLNQTRVALYNGDNGAVILQPGTGNVGISTNSTPSEKLTVEGNVSASTYYGDGSNLTGISSDPFPYTGSAIISGSLNIQSNQDDALTIGGNNSNTAPSFIKFTNGGSGISTGASIEFPFGQLIRGVYSPNGFTFYDKNQTDNVKLSSNNLQFSQPGTISFGGNDSTSTIANVDGTGAVLKYKVGGYHTFESYNGGFFEVARIDNQGIDVTGDVSASTYYGDGSNLTGISSDPFPYTGSAIISGSLILTGSFNAQLPTSSTDTYFITYNTSSYSLEARQVATLINPQVEYTDITSSISSGTSITLPNNLSYISSSTYEYLEVFFNGLRLRYDRDFIPTSTTTIQTQISFPSGSELTFKSLKA